MHTLILAGTSILAIAPSAQVTTHEWGWETPGAHWPSNAGVTVAEVESVPAGCAPGWSYDGESFEAPAMDMGPIRAAAHVEIDRIAGSVRASVLTMVPGQEMTYLRKEDQARAYLADGDPDDADYLLLQASVGADAYPTGHPNAGQLVATVAEAAAVVMMVSDAWTGLGATIEHVRLRGKRLVTLAEDQAEVDAIKAWCSAAYTAALAGEALPAEPE
jgi:hypothetical protein